jgi:hypothetical protein
VKCSRYVPDNSEEHGASNFRIYICSHKLYGRLLSDGDDGATVSSVNQFSSSASLQNCLTNGTASTTFNQSVPRTIYL